MIEFLFALTIGWALFWAFFISAMIFITESEFTEVGFILIVAIIGVLLFKGDLSLTYIAANWAIIGSWYLMYLVAGAGWSTIKWWMHTHSNSVKENFKNGFNDWKNNESYKNLDHEGKILKYRTEINTSMSVYENKRKLINWAMWWIPSLIWSVFHDLIKYVWETVYNLFVSVYNAISNSAINSIDFGDK